MAFAACGRRSQTFEVRRRGVHVNSAFQAHAGLDTLVCPSDDCAGLLGMIIRGIDAYAQPGHFEVVLVQSLDVSDSANWEDTG